MTIERLGGESLDLPRSLWAATAIAPPPAPPLDGDATADVAIIGAGFLGLTAALHLAEARRDVIVIDAAEAGWGASGRNNGQVIPGLKHDPDTVEAMLGREAGRRLVDWSGRAPGVVFDLIARHAIDCHPVRQGWIQPAYAAAHLPEIESRCRQWRERGADTRMLAREEASTLLGTSFFPGAWFDPRGGSIQPLSYARGLAHAAVQAGARLHGRTMARALRRDGGAWRVETASGAISAGRVVIATNAYGALVPKLARAIVPVRTAQVATRPLGADLLATILPRRHLASDTRNLLTSYRLSPDGRLVMGGSGATGGAESDRLRRHLHCAAHEVFGHLGTFEWDYFWSGYLALTHDHLPHVHEIEPGLIAGIGCNGRGIAVATGVGKLVAEWLLGRPAAELEVPVSAVKPIALHAFRDVGIATATIWKRWRDRARRRATRV